MILSEEHSIRRSSCRELFDRIDDFCYRSKNLHNQANYLITQSSRISRKLREEEPLETWESEFLARINAAIEAYNESRPGKKRMSLISSQNSVPADAYFLSWHLKWDENYKAMPYATCAQICIQEVCRDWKSFFRGLRKFRRDPGGMAGMPRKPGYLDKKTGRYALVLTSQNIRIDEEGNVSFPAFLKGLHIRARHKNIHQARITTGSGRIRVLLLYEQQEAETTKASGCMGIDPGVDNQNFTAIPHWKLIQMICYKAELTGIRVVIVDEKYTSGTSYHDCELPEKECYRKERRKKRGLFICEDGYRINADTNAAYQMMKKAGFGKKPPKTGEKVTRLQVA